MTKTLFVCALCLLVANVSLIAQAGDRERPEPTYDAVVEYLGITADQLECLDANRDNFLDAVEPSQQQLRDLKRQFRQAARDGADTTSIQSQIDAVEAVISGIRSDYTGSAQACIGGQTAALAELIAAETLMVEVGQAARLMLLQPTSERPEGRRGGRRSRRGPGPQGGQ
jgi:hypothetical protein